MQGYLCIGGIEVVNNCRDSTYFRWGQHPAVQGPICTHPEGSYCCWDDPDLGPWVDPVTDDAPWINLAIPESSEFLGIHIEEMKLSTPLRRSFSERRNRSILTSRGYATRELTVTGWALTTSCCATDYARQWIYGALAQENVCGPGGCSLPDVVVRTCGYRVLRGASLTDFEWGTDSSLDCCYGAKFSFTLGFEWPFMFSAPESPCFEGGLFGGPQICRGCLPVCDPIEPCCECGACSDCENCEDCDVLGTPFVSAPITEFCYPETIERYCCRVDPSDTASGSGSFKIDVWAGPELYPGGPGLKNLSIKAWVDRFGTLDPDSPDFDGCNPCVDLQISCIPANSHLVIDGTTQSAYVECGNTRNNAYKYLSSNSGPLVWPEASCYPLLVCIEADAYNTGTSTAKIEFWGKEYA